MTKASTIINKSPRKVRLMIDPIRGQRLDKGIEIIRTMNKGKTKKIYDLIRSAAFNGGLVEKDYSNYSIGTIFAEEAQRLYRVIPRARGSAARIRRRYSRVKVELVKIA
jgi:large subunit ribosomal protein L22